MECLNEACVAWGVGWGVTSLIIVMLGVVVAITVVRARRKRLHMVMEKTRVATIELLQTYVEDEDVFQAVLPVGCIDFQPNSPVLAAGGGGRVFKCTATWNLNSRFELKEEVALKELYGMAFDDTSPESLKELGKELGVLMKLKHDHIVKFFGLYLHTVATKDGASEAPEDVAPQRYFLVSQYAANGSMDKHMARPFSEITLQQRLQWTRQLALALHYLHREHWAHRDVKPQNVLLDSNWNCLLADFGISRFFGTDAHTLTTKIGTLRYLPPEALGTISDGQVIVTNTGTGTGTGTGTSTGTGTDTGSRTDAGVGVDANSAGVANAAAPKPEFPTSDNLGEAATAWDVYSFAVLVASLFNRSVDPHPGLQQHKVVLAILLNDLRPSLPSVLSKEFHGLLTKMWQRNFPDRPTFEQVLNELDAIAAPFQES